MEHVLVAAVITAALTFLGTVMAARYGKLGALAQARPNELAKVYDRLYAVEEKEAKCRDEVFDLRTDVQTLVLAYEILVNQVPQGDEKVQLIVDRLAERHKRLLKRD